MNGSMTSVSFYSKLLEHTFDLFVYLPPHYNPLHTYHLAIAQDGRDYFQLGKIGRKMDAAIEEGARPTIVAGIPYPSVQTRRTWYHPGSNMHKIYMKCLVQELLPFLEQQYSTWRLPHGRMLMGDSLGATISLYTALTYPRTFSRVMMHSPYVNNHVLQTVRQSDSWHAFEMYHAIGTDETEVKTTAGDIEDFLTPNRQLHAVLKSGNARYHYHEFSGGHFWKYWEKDIPDALRFMFDIDKKRE
ncbi:Enterochelin esterase [Alteribacillus persepolensis]|uniref:Enterochelin esterase n=1 Tax=Alteribacillus persepolensis TaxID=568899 RepID=A0A1G8ERK2_9BACI|nr:alpha/beta hydrolase-fold protein [Alteribacillus persepolensis]SDH72490.1 Enterochelin esterase [Alteribacillus persepolensis]